MTERLAELEEIIERSSFDKGRALREIRDDRLYRPEFRSFAKYCKERWDYSRAYVDRLIAAVNLVDEMTPIGVIPENEHQARKQRKQQDEIRRGVFSIEGWNGLTQEERNRALSERAVAQFNPQDNESIEWARWSWNPVTGCLHNCPYCYARDIANRFYSQKFEPSFIPEILGAPAATKVPARAADDAGYRNVFVCSMADLFGKWVPAEWIEAVLAEVRRNPQWNFLFLTKFPQRMAEFAYPPNAWLGTSVDLQARVKNAERAMAKVAANVRWLSLEPLLDPITIEWSLFKWIVIGGASASTQTPAWHPPRRWVWDITFAAQAHGCAVYHKDNLAERLRDYPGMTRAEPSRPDESFEYLRVIA